MFYFASVIKLQVRFLFAVLKRKQDSKPHSTEDEEVILKKKKEEKKPWM